MTGSAFHGVTVHQLDGHLDDVVHRYYLRVQYEDTDASGIVYHAQYLAFAERARSAWLRCLGIDQQALLTRDGNGFVVRHIDIDFVQAAALSAVLEITSEVMKTGGCIGEIATNHYKYAILPYCCQTRRRHRVR